jgi:hypothetical protein
LFSNVSVPIIETEVVHRTVAPVVPDEWVEPDG